MKLKTLFIVNSISPRLKHINFEETLNQFLDGNRFDYCTAYTKHPQHAYELAMEAVAKSYDIVVAVGGDGTVNEIGKALVNTPTALAIIPIGSGNGLARHFGISTTVYKSVGTLNQATRNNIDTATINENPFFCIAGLGFSAHAAIKFSRYNKRGFSSYVRIVAEEYFKYKPQTYHLIVDGKNLSRQALTIDFANSSQYGNAFKIAPLANVYDSYLDLSIVNKIPLYAIPQVIYQSLVGTIHLSPYVETIRCQEVIIENKSLTSHVDGEPLLLKGVAHVKIKPASLKVYL